MSKHPRTKTTAASLDHALVLPPDVAQAANLYHHLTALVTCLPQEFGAAPRTETVRMTGPEIRKDKDLLLVRCGLPCDTFNKAVQFRLTDRAAFLSRLPALETFFHGQPFTCWVGPDDTPPDLGEALLARGYRAEEAELGMALALQNLPSEWPTPASPLTILRVETSDQLDDYAQLIAANWNPPDQDVLAVYRAAADGLLRPDSKLRFLVAYSGAEPVCGVEFCLDPLSAHDRLVGVYGLVTPVPFRRNGFAGFLLWSGLRELMREGFSHACLQASDMGASLYRRLGFSACSSWVEYAPPTTA